MVAAKECLQIRCSDEDTLQRFRGPGSFDSWLPPALACGKKRIAAPEDHVARRGDW
jgi:hypothetical protein